MKNLFFKKKNNVEVNDILKCLGLKKIKNSFKVNNIADLENSGINDVSFFHSKKYFSTIKNTKSKLLITTVKFKDIIPKKIKTIIVPNVLLLFWLACSMC